MRSIKCLYTSLSCLALLSGAIVIGCSTRTPAFDGIANQGIVSVSPQSPFIGANVFLAQEMESSSYLYNFMRSRGAPQAIELKGASDKNAEMNLFYAREREFYAALPKVDPQTKIKEWIIRGPYPITREQYPYVAKLHGEQGGVFEIFGRKEIFGGPGQAIESRVIAPAFIPTPQPKIKHVKKHATKKPDSTNTPAAPAASLGPIIAVQGTPINLDQAALIEAKRAATAIPAVTTPAVASPDPSQQPTNAAKLAETAVPAAPSTKTTVDSSKAK